MGESYPAACSAAWRRCCVASRATAPSNRSAACPGGGNGSSSRYPCRSVRAGPSYPNSLGSLPSVHTREAVDSGWTATSSLNRDGQRFLLATSGMISCHALLPAGQA